MDLNSIIRMLQAPRVANLAMINAATLMPAKGWQPFFTLISVSGF
jgi:hypothetical protein